MASEVVGDPLPHVKLIHFERARRVSPSLILKMAPEDIDYEGAVMGGGQNLAELEQLRLCPIKSIHTQLVKEWGNKKSIVVCN